MGDPISFDSHAYRAGREGSGEFNFKFYYYLYNNIIIFFVQAKCEQYWPDNDVMIYGDISVEHIGENELDNYTTRDFVLTSLVPDSDRKQVVRQVNKCRR